MRAFLVLVLWSTSAAAQPAPPAPVQPSPPVEAPADAPVEAPPSPAMVAFEAGRTLLDAGQYEEACAKFTASITLDPNAHGTLLNLGLCNEKLGKTATALAWYRKAQFRSSEAQKIDDEAAAKERTIVLAAKVPTLQIEAVRGAVVTLDGNVLSEVDRARVEVDPGTHVIEAKATTVERRTITIQDGEKQSIDLRPPPPKRYVVVDHGVTQRRYAYVAFGAGGALYLASATLSLIGRSKYDEAEHRQTYQRWQNTVRYGGTSLFLAGSAAIATGVYLYVKAPRAERVLAPTIGSDQLGVSFAGSF